MRTVGLQVKKPKNGKDGKPKGEKPENETKDGESKDGEK